MHKRILILCLSLILALPFTAHAAKDALRIGVAVDAKNLDPQNSVDTFSFGIIRQINEPLFTVDGKTKKLVPVLVDKWELLDPETYKLYLKKGVKFHNGEELTAEDVVFSFKRLCSPDSVFQKSRGKYVNPDGFQIIDKYTLIMKTNGPVGDFLGSMKHPYANILSKKAVTELGKEYFRNPVGTGPYKYVKWVKGEYTDLERFDDYHGKKGNFKTIRFITLPDNSSRMIALETGKVDLIYAVPYADYDRLIKENKVKVVESEGLVLLHIGMNCQNPKLKDPRVRKAIEYAINKEAYNQVVYNGHATIPKGPLPTVSQWFPKDPQPKWPYDPEKAKALLKEAGVKDLELEVLAINAQDRIDGATMIQGMLAQVGIKVNIQIVENAVIDDILRKGKHDMYLGTWGMQTNRDAGVYWYSLFTITSEGSTNKTYLHDKVADEMILKASASTDQAEREELFQKIWDRLNEMHPFVYLSHASEIYAGAKNLVGMEDFCDGKINYLGNLRFE
ncbi:ABC transporter substrate-binding protein [Desulfovibrio sp. OttesenSCG-928-O18]|nr:ABC transporter substrate-binding protein [Desulfovibrio sp. OttesenSCG-928-O18]